jgi:hypothetical protein
MPFLAVTETAEVMVGESSDTLAAGFWSKNDQIGLVIFFASGLVAIFALVDLAAGFDVEGFAAGLLIGERRITLFEPNECKCTIL